MGGIPHRLCVRHLYNNFKKQFKGKLLKDKMWAAASAYTVQEFRLEMEKIKDIDVNAYDFLMRNEAEQWARHAFNPHIKTDSLLNNVSESFNAWVLGAREKPIITLLETLRIMFMKRFQQKRDGMKNYKGLVCPRIQKKLEKSRQGVKDCICRWGGSSRIEVKHCFGNQYVVDLQMRTCTCRKWDITGIPCSHACAAIIYHSKGTAKLEAFVDPCYSISTFLKTYKGMIEPMPGPTFWPRTGKEPLYPLVYKKELGRPKKVRRREEDEIPNLLKLKRTGTQLKCGRCGGVGRNVRSCKGEEDQKRAVYRRKEAERLR